MARNWGDVVYISTPYRPEAGSFARAKSRDGDRYRVNHWYYCRDLFQSQLYKLNLFFFAHDQNRGYAVAEFIQRVEDGLGVEPRSEFGPTQRKSVMWVEPSRWWTIKPMHRSLFTILLRCGCNYNPRKDNFDEALRSDPYSIGTEYAVRRFLAGHTTYLGKRRGWYRQFHDDKPSVETVDSLLVRPE